MEIKVAKWDNGELSGVNADMFLTYTGKQGTYEAVSSAIEK